MDFNIKDKQAYFKDFEFISFQNQTTLKNRFQEVEETLKYRAAELIIIDNPFTNSHDFNVLCQTNDDFKKLSIAYIALKIREFKLNNPEKETFLSTFSHPEIDSHFYPLNGFDFKIQGINYLTQMIKDNLLGINKTKIECIVKDIDAHCGNPRKFKGALKQMLKKIKHNDSKIMIPHSQREIIKPKRLEIKNSTNIHDLFFDDIEKPIYHSRNAGEKIHISYSIGSFYDFSAFEAIFEKEGIEAFKLKMQDAMQNNEILNTGYGYKLYTILEGLKNNFSKWDLNINQSLITKTPPSESKILSINNHYHYADFDMMLYVGDHNRAIYNEFYHVDIPVCSSEDSFQLHHDMNLNPFDIYTEENKKIIDFTFENPTVLNIINLLKHITKNNDALDYITSFEERVKENDLLDYTINYEKVRRDNLVIKKQNPIQEDKTLNIAYNYESLFINGEKTLLFYELQNFIKLSKIAANNHIININLSIYSPDHQQDSIYIGGVHLPTFNTISDTQTFDIFKTSFDEDAYACKTNNIPCTIAPAIPVSNIDRLNITQNKFHFIFDIDEVLVEGEEKAYQEYHLINFINNQREKINKDFDESPLMPFFMKIAHISKEMKQFPDFDMSVSLLTARGGSESSVRIIKMLEEKNIYVDSAFFLSGNDKTPHIVKTSLNGGLISFIDDHPIHIKRVNDYYAGLQRNVLSWHYPVGPTNQNYFKNTQSKKKLNNKT